MPLQVGTMMVVVRAQDFASRTLRRVGGELEGLSRAQAMQMRGANVAHQLRMAESYMRTAQANASALDTVRKYNDALARQGQLAQQVARAQKQLDAARAVRPRALARAQQEIAVARQEMDFFRRVREVAGRKIVSPAQRVRGIEQAEARIRAAIRSVGSATLPAGQNIANLERKLESLTNRYNQAARATGRLGEQVSKMPGWLRAATTGTHGYNQALEKSNRELATAHNNLTRAQQAQLAYNKALAAMPAQRMVQLGHALSGVGRTMQLIGLIGTGVMAASANSFANFNKEVMLAATQTGATNSSWQQLTKTAAELTDEILELTQEFPASADEMAKAAYDIFSSMDVSFGGGIDLLKRFNQLSVATLTDLETATNAGITVLNNFGGTSEDIHRTLNLMVATVRFGRMRLEDFNTMLNKVAPAAASAGQELKDVAGAMALITTRQPSQRQAATGIARLFQVFQDPDFQEGIRNASNGMVDIVEAGGDLKPLPIIVNDLADAFKGVATQKGAAQLFRQLTAVGRGAGRGLRSTIEAQRAWTFLFKNLEDYNKLQDKVTGDSKEFARALKVMSESPGVRWDVFINQMRTLILVIGEKAIPVFLKVGDAISKAVQWFRDLDDSTRDMIIRFGTWIAIGALIGGVILGIAGPIIAMIYHFKMWRTAAAGTEAKLITLAGVLRALPFAGIAVILAQFVGWQRAIELMILGWLAWKAVAIGAAAAVAIANQAAATSVKFAWRAALAGTGIGLLVVAFGFAAEYVITHWSKVKEWFLRFWEWLQISAFLAVNELVEVFSHIPGEAGQWARDLKDTMNEKIGQIRFAQHMREETKQTGQALDELLKSAPKKFRRLRLELKRQLKEGDFAPGVNREGVQRMLQFYNEALKRMRENKDKKSMEEEGLFSDDFWATLGAKNAEDFSKQLQGMYDTQIEGAKEAATWQKELTKTQKDAADQAVETLRQMYSQMLQENRTFFGELFQGPWLTSETFDLAQEWGITPRIQDMIKDLRMQNQQFEQWRASLDKLFAKGLPTEFINQLREKGPEAQPLLDEILSATPSQVANLVAQWKRSERNIEQATKMDFSRQINQFKAAGTSMGKAMIDGFQDAGVGMWFDGWIKRTFPTLIGAAVNEAVLRWKQEHPKPATQPGTGAGAAGAGGAAPKKTTGGAGDDNSKTVNVTVNVPPHTDSSDAARVRRAGYAAAHRVQRVNK